MANKYLKMCYVPQEKRLCPKYNRTTEEINKRHFFALISLLLATKIRWRWLLPSYRCVMVPSRSPECRKVSSSS